MANRPRGFGLTRELDDKMRAKYSEEEERVVTQWIEERTGDKIQGQGWDAFRDFLVDGKVLRKVISSFADASINYNIKDTSTMKIAAMRKNVENENVEKFLKAAEKMGMKRGDMFQTVNIQDSTNMHQVITTMFALSTQAQSKGYPGPHIGTKMATENKRSFDEETLKAGQNVIGLQMGTNQVASQQGMTGYGQGRQIIHKTN